VTFGWQGFAFDHPDDWAPVALTGRREEGYARVSSPTKASFQARWHRVRSPGNLQQRLKQYFQRLEQDARRAKQTFSQEFEEKDGRLLYHWTGAGQGRGALFHCPESSRVFILEAVGDRRGSLLSPFRSLIDSFRSFDEADPEEWSLFGLSLRLPPGLSLERKTLRAGRTELVFKARGARIWADRWGFGEQLIQKHGLEPWARAALNARDAVATLESDRVELLSRSSLIKPAQRALALYQPARNQIVTVRVASRSAQWRPDWDWLI
jgi:hypothetical protein